MHRRLVIVALLVTGAVACSSATPKAAPVATALPTPGEVAAWPYRFCRLQESVLSRETLTKAAAIARMGTPTTDARQAKWRGTVTSWKGDGASYSLYFDTEGKLATMTDNNNPLGTSTVDPCQGITPSG
jgi:hypothetical protein